MIFTGIKRRRISKTGRRDNSPRAKDTPHQRLLAGTNFPEKLVQGFFYFFRKKERKIKRRREEKRKIFKGRKRSEIVTYE